MLDQFCLDHVAQSGALGVRHEGMRCRSVAFLAFALLLLAGCLSQAKPDKESREESFARAKEALAAHRSELGKATFLVFSSDSPAAFDFDSHGDRIDVTMKSDKTVSGLATAIAGDGYLITAAHVLKKHCYVAGWMDGQQSGVPARVVYRQLGGEFGEDLAILHVDKKLDCPIQLEKLNPAMREIYAFSCDRQPELKIILVAGDVLRPLEPKANEDLSIMEMDLPLWKGDSGAGVISKEGKLVGVFVGLSRSLTTLKVSRVACLPDMDRIREILEKDRSEASGQAVSQERS